jgi:hypothetical protein
LGGADTTQLNPNLCRRGVELDRARELFPGIVEGTLFLENAGEEEQPFHRSLGSERALELLLCSREAMPGRRDGRGPNPRLL